MKTRTRAVLIAIAAIFIYMSATAAISGQNAGVQSTPGPLAAGTAISVPALAFAESLPVRDLSPVAAERPDRDARKDVDGTAGREIHEMNLTRRADPNAAHTADEALWSASSARDPVTTAAPNVPSVSFEGISIANTIALGHGYRQPSPTGEAGPNHYVQAVSSAFRVWDKAGTPLTPLVTLATLFAPLGYPCTASVEGFPTVLYDQLADRWLISKLCFFANPNTHQAIAISKTGDPTGAYYLYDFMMPNNKANADPRFGMWPDAYYMTDHQYPLTGTGFLQTGVFAFDRTRMLAGDPAASFVYFDTALLFPPGGVNGPDGIRGMLPADLDGYTTPPDGSPAPFAQFQANEFGEPADQIRLFDFHVDFATPANSTFTERAGSPLAVAAFDPVGVLPNGSAIPQPPPATADSYIYALGERLMFRLAYRNLGNRETLVTNHTVNAAANPAYRAGVRWYELSRVSAAAAWTVAEQQTWTGPGGDTSHRWMGSAAMNFLGDLVLGYSVSSTTIFPSIRYAAKLNSDPAGGGLAQGEQTIVDGGGSQTHTSGPWGTYSHMAVDPSDDCSFWYTAEYYPVSSETGNPTLPWHTRIAKFAPGACSVSPRATISGTISNCKTGAPIPNAMVSISGGFSRQTAATGTYAATVVPGGYGVVATLPGYNTASATLSVANGGTGTFNACLNGILVQPVADGAAIISAGANGVIDPNETVTVNFGIVNNGTLDTTNLVGTLQSTGGVTSPSGPQNYGVVSAGGASVVRSFTFTAANLACGGTLTATLQLQDGATNLGTLTYTFTLNSGTLTSKIYGTGTIAVPIPDSYPIGVDIPLTVPDVMTLSDVNVAFRIDHTFVGDINITLQHPDGTIVPIAASTGAAGQNFGTDSNDASGIPTVIDDQAAAPLSGGTAPYSGSFRPSSPLSVLQGKPSNGTWILRISDVVPGEVGTVGTFALELNKRVACPGALINAGPPPVFTAEGISPPNNAADPNETVTVSLALGNLGLDNTSNLVATLQPSGGVIGPSGPQAYGVVVAGGTSVARSYTFTASGTCASNITLTLALQDGPINLGTISYTLTLGSLVPSAIENFDGVTAPALPAGWTTAFSGSLPAWTTSTINPFSAPNDAFGPNANRAGNTELISPDFAISSPSAQLTFRNLYNTEPVSNNLTGGFDGMVLEISVPTVNGGAFQDILAAGGSFVVGGYNRTIQPIGSPIAGRQAWSGLSAGTTAAPSYILTTVNLPASANGQLIKLKWRMATDTSVIAAGQAGGRIDHISIAAMQCLSAAVPGAPTGAAATTGTQRSTVSFTAPASNGGSMITGYTVSANPAGGLDIHAGTTALSHVVSGLTGGIMYTFTVRAGNAVGTGPASAPSNSVLVALFTDHPLQAGMVVKAVHILELRQRIDAQRVRFGRLTFSWTDPSITAGATGIRAVHITDLRTALSQAYVAAGRAPLPSYTDPTLGVGFTVKLAHIAELRAALLAIE